MTRTPIRAARPWRPLTSLAAGLAAAALLLGAASAAAQGAPAPGAPARLPAVQVVSDAGGQRLTVDGKDFLVVGMNWDYVPIGQNYSYSLWTQPDEVITAALDREMPLLRAMGVNAIRQYVGIPPRWVRYIHERYGIFTVLNHTVARYGYTIDGAWVPENKIDYSDPKLRQAVKAEVLGYVDQFKDTPGVLIWLLGNENNYGLHWKSSEIEALPLEKRDEARARYLYSLMGEITLEIKARDGRRPVAIANGDVQYIDLIAQECKGLDIFGANVYRGVSALDLFQVVKDRLGLPVLFTEFGADAYDARAGREDDLPQARYLLAQWEEIYEQSAGKGRVGNAIGGLTFQFSDGWWKYRQEVNLDLHDTNASWPNGGYLYDYVKGKNNMNEEWWGLCAKGPPDAQGLYDLYPRTAYYVLQQAYRLPPYGAGTSLDAIRGHFGAIDPITYARNYRNDKAAAAAASTDKVRLKNVVMKFETYSTGAQGDVVAADGPPRGFDHMESFFATAEVKPTERVVADLSLNVLGHVASNPIDEIFYERRGKPVTLTTPDGSTTMDGVERVKIYGASVAWDDDWFRLDGFYRTGHYHWQAEGDFFGVYREANYGPNLDTYNADAPLGVELAGKQALEGFKIAFGPQLWWGANPAIVGKYRVQLGRFDVSLVHHEDLAKQTSFTASSSVPLPPTRSTSVSVATDLGPIAVRAGAIMGGFNKVGDTFRTDKGNLDEIRNSDTLGGKLKLQVERGRYHWYAQGAYMGLVADGGPTSELTYTGWALRDSGSGNQVNAMTGVNVILGDWQVAPNVLWQKPLEGPTGNRWMQENNPERADGKPDPFAVRGNRELVGGEVILAYDPTPATWLWAWDSDAREDARLAGSISFIGRHQPTSMDNGTGYLEDGVTLIPIGAPPAHDLWEIRARLISAVSHDLRIGGHAWVGTAEPNGSATRLVHRQGADLMVGYKTFRLSAYAKRQDYGPYDYHRDFNMTFPLQLMGDVSWGVAMPNWYGHLDTRWGVRGTIRTLDWYSNRADTSLASPDGNEYEIRTYVNIGL
ncbi:MAG: hypothetical protein QM767_18565 [Anaeromyxobacter sp.]